MFSRRSFLARLSVLLGGASTVPKLVEAAESEPPPPPLTARERSTRAFVDRLDACCRKQGKTLGDLAREVGEILGRRIRPERLIPMCHEGEDWVFVVHIVADILNVNVSWLVFGEDTAIRRRWIWRTASTKCLASPLKVLK